jgi:hypothetical protein
MLKPLLAVLLGLAWAACGREPAPARPAAAPASTPAQAPSPAPSPIGVVIELDAKGGSPLAREWMKELQAVLLANPERFRVAQTASDADLKVRIERVEEPKDSPGHQLMTLWLSVGQGEAKRFTLDYTGGPAAMAGRLARFLHTHAQQESAGPRGGAR